MPKSSRRIRYRSSESTIDNTQIAELLAQAAESSSQPLQRALRRAARKALLWPEEAADLLREKRALTEFPGVGPYIEKHIRQWIENPPEDASPPPRIRSGFLSVPQAQSILRKNPSWRKGIRGDLQMHSEWSDGASPIAEMSDAADDLGYEYIAITDHAKGLKIAGGIDESQLREQAAEIEAINAGLQARGRTLRVLRSIELNLNPRGEGDMDSAALAELDVVLGCFHSSLRKTDDQTERYLAALRNPDIQILGHPRGRIYNYRMGLSADWSRVFAMAAEFDKAVEIDAYPDRQDLSSDLLPLARQEGCRISLGTDSHGPSQLRFMELGMASALQAGIDRRRILNFLDREELLSWVAQVRAGPSALPRRRTSAR